MNQASGTQGSAGARPHGGGPALAVLALQGGAPFWRKLQPDWPMVAMEVTIVLLMLTLVGFLIAALLLRRRNNRKAEHWGSLERTWSSLLRAVCDGSADSAAIRSTIAPREELFFVDFLYKRALQTDDPEDRATLSRLATPYLPRIASRTRGGDPERRARAVKTLAELGGKSHGHLLVAALDDPSPLVAMSAARGLAQSAGASSVREIVSRIGRFSDWNRRFLRATLTQLGPPAIPALRDIVRERPLAPGVRAVCMDALAELDDRGAAELAELALWTEEDVDLRAAALRLLRRCGGPEHAEVVRPLCAHEDPVIRAQAVGTLATIGEERDMAVLERAVHDPSAWVALHAARGLKSRGRSGFLRRAMESEDASAPAGLALQVLLEEG